MEKGGFYVSILKTITVAIITGCLSIITAQEIWINCGGQEYTDRYGREFQADVEYSPETGYGYVGGELLACSYNASNIPENYEQWLLHKIHKGKSFDYIFDVSAGSYVVTFYFIDFVGRHAGSFPFNLLMEDRLILDSFSIFNEAGRLHQVVRRFIVDVSDGQLNINFRGLYWGENWPWAQVAAVGVSPISGSVPEPNYPDEFEVIESYGMNLLIWSHPENHTLAGYNVYRSQNGEFERLNDSLIHVARYYDSDVISGIGYQYCITSVNLEGKESNPSAQKIGTPLDKIESILPVYSIEIEPDDLESMWHDIYTDEYTPCTFHYDNHACSAGVRFRGNHERSIGTKIGWKIRFPQKHDLIGEKKINLKAETTDPSLLREGIFFSFSEDLDVPTIERSYVHLEVNDFYQGVFLQKEQVEEGFLESRNMNAQGSLYKIWNGNLTPCESDSIYRECYYKETGDLDDYSDIISFITLLDTTSSVLFPDVLSCNLDLKNFASWYCLANVVYAIDFHCRNNYLYRRQDGKWILIPWDFDSTFPDYKPEEKIRSGIELNSSGSSVNVLFERFLSVPAFRLAYCNRVYQFLSFWFTETAITNRVDSLYNLIKVDGGCDVWKKYGEKTDYFPEQPEFLKNWSISRRNYLLNEGINLSMPQRSCALRINEIATQPQAWVELINSGETSINLSGFKIDNDLGQPGRWALPDTVLDSRQVLLIEVSDSMLGFLDAGGGEIVVYDREGEPVDAWFYDYVSPGASMGRWDYGSDRWQFFDSPTPGEPNVKVVPQSITITPNVVRNSTYIQVHLNRSIDYYLDVYDASGRRVKHIYRPGNGTIIDVFAWEARDDWSRSISSGVYFFVASTGQEVIGAQKVVVIK